MNFAETGNGAVQVCYIHKKKRVILLYLKRSSCVCFQTQFLFLPSEVLSKIIEYLGALDRQNLGQTHDRLRTIEEKTGYRRFNCIEFTAVKEFLYSIFLIFDRSLKWSQYIIQVATFLFLDLSFPIPEKV